MKGDSAIFSANPILIAANSYADRALILNGLRWGHFTNPVRVVHDGIEAMDYLAGTGPYCDRNTYPLPQLILCDLLLPYVDGFELLNWWRLANRNVGLTFVILCNNLDSQLSSKARKLGGICRQKPQNSMAITEFARELRDDWFLVPDGDELANSFTRDGVR